MEIVITRESAQVLAVVRGEVDADNRDELGAAVLDDAEGASKVAMDLSGLTFIDSSGIGELLRINQVVTERGQEFEIVNPSEQVMRILEMTGLTAHFGLSQVS